MLVEKVKIFEQPQTNPFRDYKKRNEGGGYQAPPCAYSERNLGGGNYAGRATNFPPPLGAPTKWSSI